MGRQKEECMNNRDLTTDLLHTPEGVRDYYGSEYARRSAAVEAVTRQMRLYGYEMLKTPTFEFFDVFSRQIGTTPSRELYKFFDKEGSTLVLRPDFTPSVARCAAKYFAEETKPLRFCYEGSAFVNSSNLQGKLKEQTQAGAELINDGSVQADAEIIALLVEILKAAGLTRFQISVGNVEYFKGICEEAGLSEETERTLRDYISGKNYFAAEDLLASLGFDKAARTGFLEATDFLSVGIRTGDALSDVLKRTKNERAAAAIRRLIDLMRALETYGAAEYVSIDLSLLSRYHYYTGVIFKGYTYGTGDAIATGGRYDSLLSQFGKDAPAIGFMVQIDSLVEALQRQGLAADQEAGAETLFYDDDSYEETVKKARDMRAQGKAVVLWRR